MRSWGHVRLFSPFGLNASRWSRQALTNQNGSDLPSDTALLTGREFAASYLAPLSAVPSLAGRIHEGVEVRCIGRSATWKGDLIGQPARGDDVFRLLLFDGQTERDVQADYVLDCSGTYGRHNWLGAGGNPCVGERTALSRDNYVLPDSLGEDRRRFAGQRTLVVGSGYSAATSVVQLAELAETEPGTRITWLTRTTRATPVEQIESDALAERDALAGNANLLALSETSAVDWRPGRVVHKIERAQDEFIVSIKSTAGQDGWHHDLPDRSEVLMVDQIIANVGYKPDRGLYEELQVHECYATQGPIKLAAALLGETSADCLNQSSPDAELLRNPEPGFFVLGAKSYGRDSRFLIKVGLEQIEQVFSMLPTPAPNASPSELQKPAASQAVREGV